MRYFIILFFIITHNGFSQSNDCKKFKIGTFKYFNSDEQDIIITRNDSIQIETDTKNSFKLTGSIKWLSDCKYTLTYIKVNNPDYSSIVGTTFNVDITSVKNNTYTYTAYDNTRKIDGEIVKLKQ